MQTTVSPPAAMPDAEQAKNRSKITGFIFLGIATLVMAVCIVMAIGHPQGGPSNPKEEQIKLGLATARLYEQKLRLFDAEQKYLELLNLDPHNFKVLHELAEFYVKSRRFDEAHKAVEEILTYYPGKLEGWPSSIIRAFQFGRSDGYPEARKAVEDSIKTYPDRPNLLEDLASLNFTYCSINRKKADPDLDNKIAESESLLKKVLTLKQPDSTYYFHRGELSIVENDWKGGREAMENAIKLGQWTDPWQGIMAKCDAAIIELHQGDPTAAKPKLEDALSTYESWNDFHFGKAKPIREYILMSMHVYYGTPVNVADLKRYQEDYRKLEENKVGGDLEETNIRQKIPAFYEALNNEDLSKADDIAESMMKDARFFTGCATQSILVQNFEAMVWMELGDLANRQHKMEDARDFFHEAAKIFPNDPIVAKRLDNLT